MRVARDRDRGSTVRTGFYTLGYTQYTFATENYSRKTKLLTGFGVRTLRAAAEGRIVSAVSQRASAVSASRGPTGVEMQPPETLSSTGSTMKRTSK